MLCQCAECGVEFESKHASMLCPQCKATPLVCVVCGKEFPKKYSPYNQKTCSSKCRGIYRKESGIGKAVAAKMLQTKIDKYGTLDPTLVSQYKQGSSLAKRTCPLCGKEFTPTAVRQVYCDAKHYGPCPVCGKQVEIKDYSIGPQACSDQCRVARINATCLQKYGNKDAVNSQHAKELARKHSLERYGVEYYSQTLEYKERFKQTSLSKYGTEHPMQCAELQEKCKQTNMSRYGETSYMKTEEGKRKIQLTYAKRYGGIGLASPQLKQKIVSTNLQKYGVKYPINNSEVKAKAIKSIRARYKVDNYFQSKDHLKQVIVDPTKVDNYYAFKQDPKVYIEQHYGSKPPIGTLCRDLGVSDTPIYDILIRRNCQNIISHSKVSTMEHEMKLFLLGLVADTEILVNDRKAISPLELDFYLPSYHLAIECNPTITHNSTIDSWGSDHPKPYNYHYNKSMLAEQQGVFLMHVFGYEWTHKREIIKSMIRNALNKNTNRIYARNTKVIEIDPSSAESFLNNNHRQGNCVSRIRLGLIDTSTEELVSVMTFGLTRPSMGREETDTKNCYELLRFCNKLNTSVIGGASKLFKHFLLKYNPEKVVSFSDVAHTRGNLYPTLGFTKISHSEPGYSWVRLYGDVFRNRVSCQKHILPKLFDDVTEADIRDKSERQIMIEHGYVQVYDSGVIRWEYVPNAKKDCI